MLAMVVNDNVGCLTASGAPDTIASMLAPTGIFPSWASSAADICLTD